MGYPFPPPGQKIADRERRCAADTPEVITRASLENITLAVREAHVYQHNGGPNKEPLEITVL